MKRDLLAPGLHPLPVAIEPGFQVFVVFRAGLGVKPLGGDLRSMLVSPITILITSLLASNTRAGSVQPDPSHTVDHSRPSYPNDRPRGAYARAFNVCRSTRRTGHLHPTHTRRTAHAIFGMDYRWEAGGGSAVIKLLADRLTCGAQQALPRCRSDKSSGRQPAAAVSSQVDEHQKRSAHGGALLLARHKQSPSLRMVEACPGRTRPSSCELPWVRRGPGL